MNLPTSKITFIKPNGWRNLPLYKKIEYYSTTLDKNYSIYVDKLEAKKIVSELTNNEIKIAKVIKELKNINDIKESDINPDHLLKTTHGSKWNLDFRKTSNMIDIRKFLIDHNKIFTYSKNEKQYFMLNSFHLICFNYNYFKNNEMFKLF